MKKRLFSLFAVAIVAGAITAQAVIASPPNQSTNRVFVGKSITLNSGKTIRVGVLVPRGIEALKAQTMLATTVLSARANAEAGVTTTFCLNGITVQEGQDIGPFLNWLPDAEPFALELTSGLADIFRDRIAENGGSWTFIVLDDEGPVTGPNTVSAGPCSSTGPPFVPMPAVVTVCSPQLMERAGATPGLYHEIPIAQWLDPDSPYHGMPAAKFSKGGPLPSGTTCDNRPGYTNTGRLVDGVGGQGGGDGQVYPEYVFG